MGIQQNIQPEDKLGSAVRYQNPKGKSWFRNSSGRKLYIEPQALDYIENLNGYDQAQVCRGIERLSAVPSPQHGMVQKIRPAHFKAVNAEANFFNYRINYYINSELVVIYEISLNDAILGHQPIPRNERACLYKVRRGGSTTLSASSSLADANKLDKNWATEANLAVTDIKTTHAAVNGMLNHLQKAASLMGVHAEHAYPQDKFNEYTLFHNPHESFESDLFESVRDNLGLTTSNAKQLAAILADVQRKGKPVKWVVHSQGGIIFKQAIAHYLRDNPGQMLDKNTVVFHAGGNNKRVTSSLLSKVGIKKAAPDKDNPFDLVPNLAGGNDLSLSAMSRSLTFLKKIVSNTSNPAESPHTLPFISLEAYHRFLTLAGDNRSAERVKKYMDKVNGSV